MSQDRFESRISFFFFVQSVYSRLLTYNNFVMRAICMKVHLSKMIKKNTRLFQQLAREKKVFLMEAAWSRFFPLYDYIRKTLKDGKIGQVRHVTVTLGIDLRGSKYLSFFFSLNELDRILKMLFIFQAINFALVSQCLCSPSVRFHLSANFYRLHSNKSSVRGKNFHLKNSFLRVNLGSYEKGKISSRQIERDGGKDFKDNSFSYLYYSTTGGALLM